MTNISQLVINLKKTLAHILLILIISLICLDLFADQKNYTVIPLEFFSQVPVANIKLNNRSTSLIVDLGTSGFDLMLSKEVLNKCDAKLISIDNKNFFTNYRRQRYPIKNYLISDVQLGSFKFNKIFALEYPGTVFFSDKPEQLSSALNNGTIGNKLLKHFYVVFDYAHHKVVLFKDLKHIEEYKVDQWKRIPIYYASDSILTKGTIGKLPVKIILDTGNNALTMSSGLAKKIGSEDKLKSIDEECSIVSNLQIGDYLLKKQNFLVHDSHPEADISLGWDFFKNHIVYFNFKEMYMAVKS